MKVVTKPIEVVAWFNLNGELHPARFRYSNDEGLNEVIKIDKILYKDKEKLAGNEMMKFTCQSEIEGVKKIFEIKYELGTMKWILFKI